MLLNLPVYINSDGLLPFLAQLDKGQEDAVITLDFAALRRVSPAALAALVATVVRWRNERRRICFYGLEKCAITGYLQRMNVFSTCGIDLPEKFRRHEATGRFVPVQPVELHVEKMGHAMAACVAPGGDDYGHPMSDLYDLMWYILTEAANNIRQHSGGTGYATAQVTRTEGLVRLALADNGKGILRSFQEVGLPWSAKLDDAGAIRKALEPLVSSKGTPTNEGVGLTLMYGLARLTKAWLLIVSGRGLVRLAAGKALESGTLPEGRAYSGTLLALTFPQTKVRDFASLLTDAKREAGLLQSPDSSGRFES